VYFNAESGRARPKSCFASLSLPRAIRCTPVFPGELHQHQVGLQSFVLNDCR